MGRAMMLKVKMLVNPSQELLPY